jgi:nicotinamide-nucleotide amidase
MLEEQVLPELAVAGGAAIIRARELHCVGIPESELADQFPDLATAANPRMAFLPGGGEIRLRFVARGATPEECVAALDEAERVVRERCGAFVYGVDVLTLEAVVGEMLTARSLSVATAESCTAGALAARIANVPGASKYLVGGVVAYTAEAKTAELDVPPDVIAKSGSVSEEVARAMAIGAKKRFGCDYALSVTCVAGPEPQDGAPPGTMCLGIAGPGEDTEARCVRVPGDRAQVRSFAATFALNLLRTRLLAQ